MAGAKPKPWALIALGVAGAALLTDQFIVSAKAGEGDAVAQSVDADGLPVVAVAAAAPRLGMTHSARFAAFEDEAVSIGDDLDKAFRMPEPERAEIAPGEPEAPGLDELGLRLTAVLTRGDGQIAIINGRPLREGESIDGVTVLSIDGSTARVQTTLGPVDLKVERPTLGGG